MDMTPHQIVNIFLTPLNPLTARVLKDSFAVRADEAIFKVAEEYYMENGMLEQS